MTPLHLAGVFFLFFASYSAYCQAMFIYLMHKHHPYDIKSIHYNFLTNPNPYGIEIRHEITRYRYKSLLSGCGGALIILTYIGIDQFLLSR